MKRRRWGFSSRHASASWALCVGLMALLVTSTTIGAEHGALRIETAEFVKSDADAPPAAGADWRPRSLPDRWRPATRDGATLSGWYRLRFDVERVPTEPYSVYIPLIRPAATVFLNDVYLGRTGTFDRLPIADRPHFFVISANSLRTGPNELLLRVFGPGVSGLTPVTVGSEVAVRPEFEKRYFWQVTGMQFCAVFAAMWAFFSLLMWLRRRDDAIYLYFGLAGLSWAVFTMIFEAVRFAPIPAPMWFGMLSIAAIGKVVFMTLFALRYAGLRLPVVEQLLGACFVLYLGFAWIAPHIGLGEWLLTNRKYMLLTGAFGYVAIFAYAAWRKPSVETILVAIAAAVQFLNWAYQRLLDHPFGTPQYYAYDILPMILVLSWILIDRFLGALKEAQDLNTELEQRVARKHLELENSFARTRQLERQAAVVEERERIMSDMHDGIGGQLISALSLVETGGAKSDEIAAVLRECLDDLRLTIDSLEPAEQDLLAILGNFRYRVASRLQKQGIAVDWQVRELPKLACLVPQNVLHILRILQEAFTNVVKHSEADTIRVETGVDPDGRHVYIRVSDNGNGFQHAQRGRGLDNMRRRAQILGGTLAIQPSPRGTALTLTLQVA